MYLRRGASLFLSPAFSPSCDLRVHRARSQPCSPLQSLFAALCFCKLLRLPCMARALTITHANWVHELPFLPVEQTLTKHAVTPYLSCSANAKPNITDSCCVETYGGLVLSTQYWDTYTGLESHGQLLPRNTWTLHGLWPDFCNGSFTQYCDLK